MRYELYKDKADKWRWRFVASNNRIVASSSESYVNKADALHSIDLVKSSTGVAVDEKD